MQPSAATMYFFDPVNGWSPWRGTAAGFTGVTLFTVGGVALDTRLAGTEVALSEAPALLTNTLNYGFDPISETFFPSRILQDNADDVAESAAVDMVGTVARLTAFDGATFDRLRSFAGNADAIAVPTLGLLGNAAFTIGFNGATFDRLRSFAGDADALAAPTLGLLGAASFGRLFNNATYDRARSASAANISATTQISQLVSAPGNWTLTNAPAANTAATATRAAGATGVRHVLTSIYADIQAIAAIAAPLTVAVRDGATGVGTILWQARFTATIGTDDRLALSGLNIVGSAATAMTVEFTAAPGANNFETISATGYSVV